jgi:hypothetical protein
MYVVQGYINNESPNRIEPRSCSFSFSLWVGPYFPRRAETFALRPKLARVTYRKCRTFLRDSAPQNGRAMHKERRQLFWLQHGTLCSHSRQLLLTTTPVVISRSLSVPYYSWTWQQPRRHSVTASDQQVHVLTVRRACGLDYRGFYFLLFCDLSMLHWNFDSIPRINLFFSFFVQPIDLFLRG